MLGLDFYLLGGEKLALTQPFAGCVKAITTPNISRSSPESIEVLEYHRQIDHICTDLRCAVCITNIRECAGGTHYVLKVDSVVHCVCCAYGSETNRYLD